MPARVVAWKYDNILAFVLFTKNTTKSHVHKHLRYLSLNAKHAVLPNIRNLFTNRDSSLLGSFLTTRTKVSLTPL